MHMPLLKKLQIENKLLKEDLNSITPSVNGSGEDITLNNTANARFKKFKIGGNSIQDGEPSLENLVEIRNCGDNINLFDGEWEGTVSKNFIPIIKNENYIYSEQGQGSAVNYWFYETKESKEVATWIDADQFFTAPKDGFIKVSKINTTKKECKLEKGTKVTPYSPYMCGSMGIKITDDEEQEQSIVFPAKERTSISQRRLFS